MTGPTPADRQSVTQLVLDELATLADRWEAEAAEHVRLGAQYRTDRNDRLAAWAMSHADACHWHAATLRELVVHHTSGTD